MLPNILGPPLDARFAIDREVGPTEHGTLYDASEVFGVRDVAVEVANALGGPQARARFEQSLRLAERLEGEHVLRILDRGTTPGGDPVVVRERSLSTLEAEARARRIPVPEAVAWTLEASEAVAEAHALGMAHGDVRSANVHLVRDGDGPCAKLAFTTTVRNHATAEERRRDVVGLARLLRELLSGPAEGTDAEGVRTLPKEMASIVQRVSGGEIRDVAGLTAELAPFAPPGNGSARTVEFLLARAGLLPAAIQQRSSVPAESPAGATTGPDASPPEMRTPAPGSPAARGKTPSERHRRWFVFGTVLLAVMALALALRPSEPTVDRPSTTHLTSATVPDAPDANDVSRAAPPARPVDDANDGHEDRRNGSAP